MVNYRDILRQQLATRIASNHLYSLRAMARDLELSSARLSEILNGKQGLSLAKAEKIAERLELDEETRDFFVSSAEYLHAKDPTRRATAKTRLDRLSLPLESHRLSDDYFQSVADWRHFAVLYLCETVDFKTDFDWISKRLDIEVELVREIVERLIRLGFLKKSESGLVPVEGYLSVQGGTPSAAIRRFHQSILENASHALANRPMEERDFASVIIPAEKSDVEKIRLLSKEFRQNVRRILETSKIKDSVYCLSVQFFELTK